MRVEPGSPARYALRLDDAELALEAAIGSTLTLEFAGVIECIFCGRKSRNSYSQGYCFPCSQRLARCDLCIVRPETCHFHEGTCREPDWGQANCMQPHVVYLANSSGIKVGITRLSQLPTRWLDQGAVAALPIAETVSRRIAGLLEVALAGFVSDKTDWRRMLRGTPEPVDLPAERDRLIAAAAARIEAITAEFGAAAFRWLDTEVSEFDYPVETYPQKIRSLNFDKHPAIESTLSGIKGQYLLLADGVLNMRRHGGYRIEARY